MPRRPSLSRKAPRWADKRRTRYDCDLYIARLSMMRCHCLLAPSTSCPLDCRSLLARHDQPRQGDEHPDCRRDSKRDGAARLRRYRSPRHPSDEQHQHRQKALVPCRSEAEGEERRLGDEFGQGRGEDDASPKRRPESFRRDALQPDASRSEAQRDEAERILPCLSYPRIRVRHRSSISRPPDRQTRPQRKESLYERREDEVPSLLGTYTVAKPTEEGAKEEGEEGGEGLGVGGLKALRARRGAGKEPSERYRELNGIAGPASRSSAAL